MKQLWLALALSAVLIAMPAGPRSAAARDCRITGEAIYLRTSPAVVFIATVAIDSYRTTDRITTSIGSGVIIDPRGLIVTNAHMVFGQRSITVTLDDGRIEKAELVGADLLTDLALIRIPPLTQEHATLSLSGKRDLRIGETVYAIGNPFGLEQTLTMGIVSGINRIMDTAPLGFKLPLIQTDAAINPGNSGGPLLDECGDVVGINSALLGEAQNIGFAVPVETADRVVREILKNGRVIRPWLGLNGQLIGRQQRQILNLPLEDGFLLESVEPDSPAEKAGLQGGELPITILGIEFLFGGDIITEADGIRLDSADNLQRFIDQLHIGRKVNLTLFNQGKTRRVELMVEERPLLPADLPAPENGAVQSH